MCIVYVCVWPVEYVDNYRYMCYCETFDLHRGVCLNIPLSYRDYDK